MERMGVRCGLFGIGVELFMTVLEDAGGVEETRGRG